MGDQIVALKHETNGMVAVGVPVAVLVFFCGDSVDDEVTGIVTVQTADDVQQGGLSGTAWAKNGDELIVSEIEADSVQCHLFQIAGDVFFGNVLYLQHEVLRSCLLAYNNIEKLYHMKMTNG